MNHKSLYVTSSVKLALEVKKEKVHVSKMERGGMVIHQSGSAGIKGPRGSFRSDILTEAW